MTLSVLDRFTGGIGPSSSHTVGPMRAAFRFVSRLTDEGLLEGTARVRCELFGSLGATGHGHGTVPAVVLGLAGEQPHLVDPTTTGPALERVRATGRLLLAGTHEIDVALDDDVVLHRDADLDFHSNGMVLHALDADGGLLTRRTYYSVGGGFVLDEDEAAAGRGADGPTPPPVPSPFPPAPELRPAARESGLPISGVVLANERAWRDEPEIRAGLLHRWAVMRECVARGIATEGVLPGVLRVRRRAAALRRHFASTPEAVATMEWVTLDALAVNEENAAGGRVVTAPTNGAAGIVPAVLHHAARTVPGFGDDHVVRFLLTAGGG